MGKKIIIAVDGFSGCGKSTLSQQLSKALRYSYLDTGAMYRAITLYLIEQNIAIQENTRLEEALENIVLDFHFNEEIGENEILLNGRKVASEIRENKVVSKVSEVAAVPAIRRFAVAQQRKIGARKGIVMDGRDIGTVVFPNAALKIFLTASPEIRVERRFSQLQKKDPKVSRETVRKNITERDYMDTHRKESPLRQADDAIVIDNSHLSREEQLQKVLALAQQAIHQD